MKFRRSLQWALPAVLLCGCFLEQKAPQSGPPNNTQANVEGVVRLEDLSGLDLSSVTIRGTFVDASERIRLSGRVDTRADPCKVSKGTRTGGAAASARAYKDVGKLYFGPVLQGTLTEVPIQEDSRYLLTLAEDFPTNVYYVTTRKENSPQFEGYLSLPEPLRAVQGNGSDFSTDGVLYRRSEGLTLSWNAPAVASDASIMVVDLVAQGANGIVNVRCVGREPTDGGGVYEWELPNASLSQLPDADEGLIYVSRIHLNEVNENGWNVQTQGMRTRVTLMRVQP